MSKICHILSISLPCAAVSCMSVQCLTSEKKIISGRRRRTTHNWRCNMSVTLLVSHINCLLVSDKEVHRRLLTRYDRSAGFDVFAAV